MVKKLSVFANKQPDDMAALTVFTVAKSLHAGVSDATIDRHMIDYHPGDNPHWAADEDIWKKARKSVEAQGAPHDKRKWRLVAHVYKSMGGRVTE